MHSTDLSAKASMHRAQMVTTILLACVCLWCASGVIAVESASYIQSRLSPWLLSLKDQVTMPCVAALLAVSPVSHVTGRSTVSGYKMWQPFRGGGHFIVAQAAGWSFWSAGSALVAVDVLHKLGVPGSTSLPCFTCTPGFLLGVVACVVVGNAALLSSLFLFSSSPPRCKSTTASLVACACSAAAISLAVMLISHPVLTPHLHSALLLLKRHALLLSGFALIGMLNRYPIQVPPSAGLDFFGRINNLYQIIAHVGVALKFVGFAPVRSSAADLSLPRYLATSLSRYLATSTMKHPPLP